MLHFNLVTMCIYFYHVIYGVLLVYSDGSLHVSGVVFDTKPGYTLS